MDILQQRRLTARLEVPRRVTEFLEFLAAPSTHLMPVNGRLEAKMALPHGTT